MFDWRNVNQVRSMEEIQLWREQFLPAITRDPRRTADSFKNSEACVSSSSPAGEVKTKEEMDDSSLWLQLVEVTLEVSPECPSGPDP